MLARVSFEIRRQGKGGELVVDGEGDCPRKRDCDVVCGMSSSGRSVGEAQLLCFGQASLVLILGKSRISSPDRESTMARWRGLKETHSASPPCREQKKVYMPEPTTLFGVSSEQK